MDPAAVPRGRARDLRTESAPLPAPAHSRPAVLPRPPRGPAPPSQLAMGQRARHRVRPVARAAVQRRLINWLPSLILNEPHGPALNAGGLLSGKHVLATG